MQRLFADYKKGFPEMLRDPKCLGLVGIYLQS